MSLTTINLAKLPKTATPNSVFYCGDTGKVYIAGPDGKVVAVDKLLVLAQGPQGEQGPPGPKGEDSQVSGPVGPPGPRGLDGRGSPVGDRKRGAWRARPSDCRRAAASISDGH